MIPRAKQMELSLGLTIPLRRFLHDFEVTPDIWRAIANDLDIQLPIAVTNYPMFRWAWTEPGMAFKMDVTEKKKPKKQKGGK